MLETEELCRGTAYYGHADILRRAAGWTGPIPAVVPHGVYLDPSQLWHGDTRARVSAVLCYPDYAVEAFERVTRKLVVPSAAPFVYALDQVPSPTEPPRGTLFFPVHSTHNVVAEQPWDDLAERLSGLPTTHGPIRVCMYWRDVQLGHHKPFERCGLDVVCAGHVFDNCFLPRLLTLLRHARSVATSGFGSHLAYAAMADRVVVPLPSIAPPEPAELEQLRATEPDADRTGVEQPPDLTSRVRSAFFATKFDETTVNRQRGLAEELLGAHNRLRSDELYEMFSRLSRLDWTGTVAPSSTGARRFVTPMAWRRLPSRTRRASFLSTGTRSPNS